MADAVFPNHFERELVADFFAGRTGVFVEVGAFDPVFQSQTAQLELDGWNGVLIEPVPAQAANLRQNRRSQVFELACVGPKVKEKLRPLVMRRGMSTLRLDRARRGGDPVINVPVATLDDVLAQAGFEHVDFVSVDVEGAELDVLRGFTLSRYKPALVLVDDRDRFTRVHLHMMLSGYKLVRRTGHNAWFVPRGQAFPVDLAGRWHLAWTYGPGRLQRRLSDRLHSMMPGHRGRR